ncbi:MAG: tRNA (guanosine(46)-N7)-methyltransferase TrmB [Actinobacteria bacterium]|nr:tRNA (guanosine(46)-N7)-methyltransferase TrmB [Actinomycetota bacterium]
MERTENSGHPNSIRTYKLRGARITPAQEGAIERLGNRFLIPISQSPIDIRLLFPEAKRRVLEIGSGMGEATASMAAADPESAIIAIEVHRPGVGSLLWRIEKLGLTNLRIVHADVNEVLRERFADESFDEIRIYFPDPWPKLRHHKRRLLQGEFLPLLASKLRSGGLLHIATDWQPYAHWITSEFTRSKDFEGGVVPRPEQRPLTRFEEQGITKEHLVTDFFYYKR